MEQSGIYLFTVLGFLAYWVVKVRAILHGYNRQNTFSDFARDYLGEIFISIIGVVFLLFGGPTMGLTLDTPLNCFIAGGAAPSMLNNVLANFIKK